MAYSEYQKERIAYILKEKSIPHEGKKFMGGYCFFIEEKMAIAIDIDKATGKDRLMVRIGEDAASKAVSNSGCRVMDITGRAMKGFVFVDPEGFALDNDLEIWVKMAVAFNPLAKRHSKK